MSAVSTNGGLGLFLRKLVGTLGNAESVHIGFLEGSTAGWNGPRPKKGGKGFNKAEKPSRGPATGTPAAYVAWVMEYGDEGHNIPKRPFFSSMIAEKQESWPNLLAVALMHNGYDSRKSLDMVGLAIKEQLQLSILNGNWAELSQSTKDRKGFDTPLIDSHNMVNAVDFVVL